MSTSTSPIWKYVGITATGAAALTIFLNYARRQDNKNSIEVERLQMMVDVLGAKIDDVERLLKSMNEEIRSQRGPRLKTSNSGGALKTVSFKLESTSTRPAPTNTTNRMSRTRSWTSITSDSEYGDAEEDW